MQRRSEKRQSILDFLRSTKEHPSAETVYTYLKPRYPDLSLGTVYRNLRQLVAEGIVRSVGVVDGEERFDATLSDHPHAVCRLCGRVTDLPKTLLPEGLAARAEEETGFALQTITLQFEGICPICREKKG